MKIHSVNNNIYQTSAVKNSKRSFGRLIGEHEFIDYVQRKSNLPYMSVKYLTETIDEVKDELNNPKLDKFVANFSID